MVGRRRRRAVRGAGRRRRGRARGAGVPLAARRDRALLGAGRHRRGAGRRRLARAPRRGHARRRPRRRPRRARCGCCARSRPERVRELEQLGVRFDADRHGALALGLEGGHSRRRDRARRRRRPPAGASRASCRRWPRCTSGSRCWSRAPPRRCTSHDGRCVGRGRAPAARRRLPVLARATVLATGGTAALWPRTHEPAGRGRCRAGAGPRGGRRAGRPRVHAVPPDRAASATDARDGFLITEAVRGEGATLLDARGERFVDELAPRDQVALAIEARAARAAAGRRWGWTCARSTWPASPTSPTALAEVGHRPAPGPGARGPGGPLHDGRRGHGPRRALVAGRPVRGRRVRLHRPARRQPAGLELARRVLRARPPRRAGRARRPASRRPAAEPDDAIHTAPPSDATRAALWRHAGLRRDAGRAARAGSTIPSRSRG